MGWLRRCLGSIGSAPSRSPMVRATFRMRSWARALRPCWVMARSSSVRNRQRAGRWRGCGGRTSGRFFRGTRRSVRAASGGANDAVANRGRGFGICAPAALSLLDTPPSICLTLARRRTETLDRRLFGSLAQPGHTWEVPRGSCTAPGSRPVQFACEVVCESVFGGGVAFVAAHIDLARKRFAAPTHRLRQRFRARS